MPADSALKPKVAILLCTYNGAKYLAEQLDSFERQTHTYWQVWASDDGSSDETRDILLQYQQKWGPQRLTLVDGPGLGSTANFMSLLYNPAIQADFYAFSDQDDIWKDDKLERALAWLSTIQPAKPALYCSRTQLVDERNNAIGFSQLQQRPPGFTNALMQNIAGGNTMVFNHAIRLLLGAKAPDVVIHDWWLYLAVSACGGDVCYDPYPSVRYRQHQDNLIGMNIGWHARRQRIRQLFKGRYRGWTDRNLQALQSIHTAIVPANKELLRGFAQARRQPLLPRVVQFKRLGLYRQTTLGNLGLWAGVVFNKI